MQTEETENSATVAQHRPAPRMLFTPIRMLRPECSLVSPVRSSHFALFSTQSLTPLCEEDNQAQEIIKKLEKSITFLNQCTTRVASRAEMLGAINQVTVTLGAFGLPDSMGYMSTNRLSAHFCAKACGWVPVSATQPAVHRDPGQPGR